MDHLVKGSQEDVARPITPDDPRIRYIPAQCTQEMCLALYIDIQCIQNCVFESHCARGTWIIPNGAITDKTAGHGCTLGMESFSDSCLVQIASDELTMSSGTQKPSHVKLGLAAWGGGGGRGCRQQARVWEYLCAETDSVQ